MGKKHKGRPQTKISQSELLEGSITAARNDQDGISLPRAPQSKLYPGSVGAGGEDGRQGYRNYGAEVKFPTGPPYLAFIGNLPLSATNDQIIDFFKDIEINSVRLMEFEGRTKGFGYIELPDAETLTECLKYDRAMFNDRAIKVDVAAPYNKKERYSSSHGDAQGQYGGYNNYSSNFNKDKSSEVDNWRVQGSNSSPQGDFENQDSFRNSRNNINSSKPRVDLEKVTTFRSSIEDLPVQPPPPTGGGHRTYESNYYRFRNDSNDSKFNRYGSSNEYDFVRNPSNSDMSNYDGNFPRSHADLGEAKSFRSSSYGSPKPSPQFEFVHSAPTPPPQKPRVDPFGGAKPRDEKIHLSNTATDVSTIDKKSAPQVISQGNHAPSNQAALS